MYNLKFCINNQNTDESSLKMFYPLLIPWILWSGDLRITGYLYQIGIPKNETKKKGKATRRRGNPFKKSSKNNPNWY